jgi:hypothetical protein
MPRPKLFYATDFGQRRRKPQANIGFVDSTAHALPSDHPGVDTWVLTTLPNRALLFRSHGFVLGPGPRHHDIIRPKGPCPSPPVSSLPSAVITQNAKIEHETQRKATLPKPCLRVLLFCGESIICLSKSVIGRLGLDNWGARIGGRPLHRPHPPDPFASVLRTAKCRNM